jgi:ABC-type transport system involved in cytochrome bd biosynthesis fused ATPase/permease subunit
LCSSKTVLVIAHRTGMLRHCDLVFELAAGKIVGSGKYGQLKPLSAPAFRTSA